MRPGTGEGLTPSAEDMAKVAPLVLRLYAVVEELTALFPGRPFTPDGHLVGSIGESLAAYIFDLELLAPSNNGYDALAKDGRTVEIKATQGDKVGLATYADPLPDHLVVLRLLASGTCEVAYNGPAAQAWAVAGPVNKGRQRQVSLSRLKALHVDPEDELPLVRILPVEGTA